MLIKLIAVWGAYIFIGILLTGLFIWVSEDEIDEDDGGVVAFMIAFWPCVVFLLGIGFIATMVFSLSSFVAGFCKRMKEWTKSRS